MWSLGMMRPTWRSWKRLFGVLRCLVSFGEHVSFTSVIKNLNTCFFFMMECMLNNALTWMLFCWICIAKLAPVGYGIKKLQIMLSIVDDLVSVDSLIEERLTVEPCNEYIQSCDIVAFNKIWEPSYSRRAGLLSSFGWFFFFLSIISCHFLLLFLFGLVLLLWFSF